MKKRAVERIPSDLDAAFIWSDRENTGSLVDISENGMLIKTETCPPMRSRFEVSLPVDNAMLKIPVRVRRVLKKGNRYEAIGLEIINPPKKYLDYINSLRWGQLKKVKTNGQLIKIYACRVCNHIEFDFAPILCPICSATIEHFEKAPDAIKKPDNFAELSDLEKMHVPSIKLARTDRHIDAHVTVGEIEHSTRADDRISFIDLYYSSPNLNKKCVSRLNFNCERMHPTASIRFDYEEEGVLTVISNCTVHGTWLSRATI